MKQNESTIPGNEKKPDLKIAWEFDRYGVRLQHGVISLRRVS